MIKHILIPMVVAANLFATPPSMTTPSKGQSRMHQMQQKHPDRLPDEQRHVLFMLSPMYQRVFLYVLDDEQREMVTVFESRGENPYQAIDNILYRDRRRADPSLRNKCSPCEKTRMQKEQKKYIISQQKKQLYNDYEQDNSWAQTDDDYEMYDDEQYASETQTGYQEKPNYKECRESRYRAETAKAKSSRCSGACSGCGGCSSCSQQRAEQRDQVQKAPAKKKSFFSKSKCSQSEKKTSFFSKHKSSSKAEQDKSKKVGGKNKYKYKDQPTKKKGCGCGS